MEKSFEGREENFIGEQADDNDDEHNPDHLFHRVQFAAVMQELSETESGQDRDENFCGHERTPRKGPALFHSADDERQRRWKDNCEPHVQTF